MRKTKTSHQKSKTSQQFTLGISAKSVPFKKTGLVTAAGILAIASIVGLARPTFADQYDDQIKAIQSQIDGYNVQAASLKAQADSLQNAIAELNAQKAVIQGQIDLSQAKHDQLVAEITTTQQKIAATQAVLASTIADMYVDSKTTPLEMVASSNNISDYVNAEQYNDVASQQIQDAIKQIKTLKAQLETQQKAVDQVLADQQAQHAVLQEKTNEQNNLLAQTQGSEAAYQSLISTSNASISSLRAAQAAANAAAAKHYNGQVTAGDPNHGGYPSVWANAAQDSMADNWGMYNRECVSYTAYKVYATYGNMPYWGGSGNAAQWPGNAARAGIPMGTTPKVHSVAIMNVGSYGHAAWVESVNGDGTVTVSQYNWDLAGHYSQMTINASAFSTYIYFGG